MLISVTIFARLDDQMEMKTRVGFRVIDDHFGIAIQDKRVVFGFFDVTES